MDDGMVPFDIFCVIGNSVSCVDSPARSDLKCFQPRCCYQSLLRLGDSVVQSWKVQESTSDHHLILKAQSRPKELAKESEQELAEKMVHEMAQEMAQALGQEVAQKMAHEMAQELGQELVQKMAQEMAQEMAQKLGEEVAHEMAEEMDKKMAQAMAQELARFQHTPVVVLALGQELALVVERIST